MQAPHNPDFDISVSDPVKQGEGVAVRGAGGRRSGIQLPFGQPGSAQPPACCVLDLEVSLQPSPVNDTTWCHPCCGCLQSYVSYKVVSRVRLPGYRGERTEVIRRFRDFAWLQHRLRSEYRGGWGQRQGQPAATLVVLCCCCCCCGGGYCTPGAALVCCWRPGPFEPGCALPPAGAGL